MCCRRRHGHVAQGPSLRQNNGVCRGFRRKVGNIESDRNRVAKLDGTPVARGIYVCLVHGVWGP